MGARGGRREWALGAAMALVLGAVAAVTLALREGEALAPPEPEAPEPADPDGPWVDPACAFLPAPLVRAPGIDGPLAPLPARIVVLWNAATEQAKVYVGQTFCGIADQGATALCVEECRRILAVSPEVRIEIDAAPGLPWSQFVSLYAAVRTLGSTPVIFAAGDQAPLPESPTDVPLSARERRLPPLCEATGPVDPLWGSRGAAWIGLDPRRHVLIQIEGDRTVTPHGLASLRSRFAAEAARHPDPVSPQASAFRVALFLPPDAEWRHAQYLMQECARVGIWDIAFAVAADPPAADGNAGQGR